MSLAYTTPTFRANPNNTSVFAAKVLYKLLVPTPTDKLTDIKRCVYINPPFPQLILTFNLYFQFIEQVCWVSASWIFVLSDVCMSSSCRFTQSKQFRISSDYANDDGPGSWMASTIINFIYLLCGEYFMWTLISIIMIIACWKSTPCYLLALSWLFWCELWKVDDHFHLLAHSPDNGDVSLSSLISI